GLNSGCARPLSIRGRVSSLRKRGTRWLRHDRVGCHSALVKWSGRNIRPFLSGCRAVARRNSKSSSFKGDGPGDDVLHPTELFLCWWNVGHVMDRLDLDQHCLGCTREEKPPGTANVPRGSRCLEG